MKIDAKITWLIGEPQSGIEIDKLETVVIDADYVEADIRDIANAIEDALTEKYGKFYTYDQDFEIENLDEIRKDLAYDEFQDKVDSGYTE